MRIGWVRTVLIAMSFVLVPGVCTHAEVAHEELQAAFRWFDGLGYPRVGELPFVRVAGGIWYTDNKGKVTTHHRYGFLIAQQGDQFTVFYPDLTQETYLQNHLPASDPKRIGIDTVDAESWARSWIGAPENEVGREQRRDGFEGNLDEDAQIFVIARACALCKHDKLAFDLIKSQQARGSIRSGTGDWGYQKTLMEHMAESAMWRSILRFGDPHVGRGDLLSEFRDISRRFRDSKLGPRAREATTILEQMVQEDKAHEAVKADKLTGKERISELIFQLRTQNGKQWSQPGACDIFMDDRGKASPAQQLVDIGFAAIPQLIEVVDDRRFTRSITFGRSFFFSHHVLRVGDAAHMIIRAIAHRGFSSGNSRGVTTVELGDAAALKNEIAAWWRDYNSRGEEALLIEAVKRGDGDSGGQALLLAQRYPKVALVAIAEGLAKAREGWVAANLVNAVAELNGEPGIRLLREQMYKGRGLSTRLNAANALRQRGDPDTVPAMVREWKANTSGLDEFFEVGGLVSFLLSSKNPEAIRSIATGLSKRPVGVRPQVALKLMDAGLWRMVNRPNQAGATEVKLEILPNVEQAVEGLMAQILLDTEERVGFGMGGRVSLHDPRICDVAVIAMHDAWPNLYAYKPSVSLFERNLQRLKLYNIWCKRNHKPLVPLPVHPKPVGEINSIRATHMSPTARRIAPDASSQLQKLTGHTLAADSIVRSVLNAAGHLGKGFTGLRFEAWRDNDGTGFEVSLDVLPGTLSHGGDSVGWNYLVRVLRDDETLYTLNGSGNWTDRKQILDNPEQLTEAIRKSLTAPRNQTVRISIHLTRTN